MYIYIYIYWLTIISNHLYNFYIIHVWLPILRTMFEILKKKKIWKTVSTLIFKKKKIHKSNV